MNAPMLVREPHTDLAPFRPSEIETAKMQWLLELSQRLSALNTARQGNGDDFEYGGAAAIAENFSPLEAAVDEARRMVYILSREARRRSEGEIVPWNVPFVPAMSMTRHKSAV